jgi:hypothetical protein
MPRKREPSRPEAWLVIKTGQKARRKAGAKSTIQPGPSTELLAACARCPASIDGWRFTGRCYVDIDWDDATETIYCYYNRG